jgi:hypothetical protein
VRTLLTIVGLLTCWLSLRTEPSVAKADGGTVRYLERHGDRLITVFTDPTPMRTGIVDVSVLLQDAESGKPLLDVPVAVRADRIDHIQQRTSAPATIEAATNKLLRAAPLNLTLPGRWHLEIEIEGLGRPIGFDVEVADALPPWMAMSLWIGWPLAAISLFVMHQILVHRRSVQRARRAV